MSDRELSYRISGFHQATEKRYYVPARNVLTMIHNAHAKHPKRADGLWSLELDAARRKQINGFFEDPKVKSDFGKLVEFMKKRKEEKAGK